MIFNKILYGGKNREWIVMLHGMGGSSNIWYKQIPFFSERYNILLVDYFGHGKTILTKPKYTFEDLSDSIIEVMDHHKIDKAHIMGISLGSIIAHVMIYKYPERIISAVLGGAVLEFDLKSKILLYIGKALRNILPYMQIYRLFALIVMPKPNHAKSRNIFIKEANRLGKKEFLKWYDLMLNFPWKSREIKEQMIKTKVKKIFISGIEDHLFIDYVIKYSKKDKFARYSFIKHCGHVCNIEKYKIFNEIAYNFMMNSN